MPIIQNPLHSSIDSVPTLVARILDIVVQIGTPIAVIFIIYSGLLFVTARGDKTQLTRAKSAFTWAMVGTAILIGASALATVIQGTIQQIGR